MRGVASLTRVLSVQWEADWKLCSTCRLAIPISFSTSIFLLQFGGLLLAAMDLAVLSDVTERGKGFGGTKVLRIASFH